MSLQPRPRRALCSALSACVVAPSASPSGYGPAARRRRQRGAARAVPRAAAAAPFADAIWLGGYWGWSGGRHVWVGGRYEHGRPGYAWEPHRWVQHEGRWHLEGGLGASLTARGGGARRGPAARRSPRSRYTGIDVYVNRRFADLRPIAGTFVAKKAGARLADFQYAAAAGRYRDAGRRAARFDLRRFDPAAKPFSIGDKAAETATVAALAAASTTCRTCSTPIVASRCWSSCRAPTPAARTARSAACSGKTSALGVLPSAWKAPTEEERAHDYLWRIHQRCRRAGEMVVFNRSHYEDVLVPVVKGWITARDVAALRADQRLRAAAGRDRNRRPQVPPPHLEGRAAAAPAGPPRRPDQALEVRRRRPRGAQPLGRLSGRLRRGRRRHRNAVGAVDDRSGRLEDASQPDDRHRREQSLQSLKLRYPPGDPALATIKVI